jgi:hypothetical protein
MTHEILMNRMSVIFPIINHAQAEHCGYHYVTFSANEDMLKKIILASKESYANANISVHLDGDKIVYNMGFRPGNSVDHFIELLEKAFGK